MRLSIIFLVVTAASFVHAGELPELGPNRSDEPFAETFSLAAAANFLDQSSLEWTENRKCFTCHTNYAYLIARPAITDSASAQPRIRHALEQLVESRWPDKGPRWDAEVVMSAAALALHDRATNGKLHATSRKALDRMWTVQREDGGFDWLKCGWPPMESDDDYGAAVALLAAYGAPDGYADEPHVRKPLRRLYDYMKQHPPPTIHHTAMLLWADSHGAQAVTSESKRSAINKLLALQQENGGWAIASLGDWKRGDGTPQDTKTSDGYGTGFVVFVLRRAGVDSSHPQLQRGLAWLRANQRASGRWYTRSLNKDSKHYISHAGTAFAALALAIDE